MYRPITPITWITLAAFWASVTLSPLTTYGWGYSTPNFKNSYNAPKFFGGQQPNPDSSARPNFMGASALPPAAARAAREAASFRYRATARAMREMASGEICQSPLHVDTATCRKIDLNTQTPFVIIYGGRNYETWFESIQIFPLDPVGVRGAGRPTTQNFMKVRISRLWGNSTVKNFQVMSHPDDGKLTFRGSGSASKNKFRVRETEQLNRLTFEMPAYELRADTSLGRCLIQQETLMRGQNKFIYTNPDARSGREAVCVRLHTTRPNTDMTVHQSGPLRTTWITVPDSNIEYILEGTLYRVFITGTGLNKITFSPESRSDRFTLPPQSNLFRLQWGYHFNLATARRNQCARPEAGCETPDEGDGSEPAAGEDECVVSDQTVDEALLPEIKNKLLMFKYRILPIKGILEQNTSSGRYCFRADPNPFGGSHRRRGETVIAPTAVRFSMPNGNDLKIEYERPLIGDEVGRDPPPDSPEEIPDAETLDRNERGIVYAIYRVKNACGSIPFIIAPGYNASSYPIRITVEDIPERCFIDSDSRVLDEMIEVPAPNNQEDDGDDDGEDDNDQAGGGSGGGSGETRRTTRRNNIHDEIGLLAVDPKECEESAIGEESLCDDEVYMLTWWVNNLNRRLGFEPTETWMETLMGDPSSSGCNIYTLYIGCLLYPFVAMFAGIACFFAGADDCSGKPTLVGESKYLGIVVGFGEGILEMASLPQANHFVFASKGEKAINLGHGNHVVMARSGQTAIQAGVGIKHFRTYSRGPSEGRARDRSLIGCGLHDCLYQDGEGSELTLPGAFWFDASRLEAGPNGSSINAFRLSGGTHRSAFPMIPAPDGLFTCTAGHGYSPTGSSFSGLDYCRVGGAIPDGTPIDGVADNDDQGWAGILALTDTDSYGSNNIEDIPPDPVTVKWWQDPLRVEYIAETFKSIWDNFEVGCLLDKINSQNSDVINETLINETSPLRPCTIDINGENL